MPSSSSVEEAYCDGYSFGDTFDRGVPNKTAGQLRLVFPSGNPLCPDAASSPCYADFVRELESVDSDRNLFNGDRAVHSGQL